MAVESVRFYKMVNRLIDVFILSILNGEPQTGYSIKKVLNLTMSVNVSYGILYPSLHNLERTGCIKGRWVAQSKAETLRKKLYRITPKGRGTLGTYLQYLQKITSTLQQISTEDVKMYYTKKLR